MATLRPLSRAFATTFTQSIPARATLKLSQSSIPPRIHPSQHRFFTSAYLLRREAKQYDYPAMKTFSQSAPQSSASQRLLIDVREPSEFADGHIPTAHNLPLNSASEDFYLPADQFAAQYGFEKPGAGQEVVFYCKRGIRSGVAVDISGKAGWEGEVGEYKGSWVDWVQREGDGGGKGEGEGVGKTVEKPVGYQPPTNDGNTPDLM